MMRKPSSHLSLPREQEEALKDFKQQGRGGGGGAVVTTPAS